MQENCKNVKFKDIREIKIVNDNKFLFTQDMPLYFRIDFLKLVIQAHELITVNKDASIFADLEVNDLKKNQDGVVTGERLNKIELLAQEWLDKLEKFGITTNYAASSLEDTEDEYSEYDLVRENQFSQMINNEQTIDSLRHIINVNTMRAVNVLNMPSPEICMNACTLDQENVMAKMYEMPFYSTICELSKLYTGIKADTIKANITFKEDGSNDQWVQYKPEIHGYKYMGNKPDGEDESVFNLMECSVFPPKFHKSVDMINFGVDVKGC